MGQPLLKRMWNSSAFVVAVFIVYCAVLVRFVWGAIAALASKHWSAFAVEGGAALFMLWRASVVIRRRSFRRFTQPW